MTSRYMTVTALSFATLVMAFALTTTGQADWPGDPNTTHMAFEHPVRVPGVTLAAGSYVFEYRQNPGLSPREFVWIRRADSGDVFGPYPIVPRVRVRGIQERVVVFDDAGETDVPTIRAWFGRGRSRGYEFVYTGSAS